MLDALQSTRTRDNLPSIRPGFTGLVFPPAVRVTSQPRGRHDSRFRSVLQHTGFTTLSVNVELHLCKSYTRHIDALCVHPPWLELPIPSVVATDSAQPVISGICCFVGG